MNTTRFFVAAMDCPVEEQLIRNRLRSETGIESLDFNLMDRVLTVGHTLADTAPLTRALDEIGMDPRTLPDGETSAASPETSARRGFFGSWLALGLSIGLAAVAETLHFLSERDAGPGHGSAAPWLIIAISVVSLVLGGRETFKKGWIAVRTRTLNINFLITIAVIGAIAIGEWPEAAMASCLFALAEKIEALSLDRARAAIRSLIDATPETAFLEHGDHFHEVSAASVAVGERIRIRPGDKIPLDATVESGESTVDQAAITGESLPADRAAGDPVFAGTRNGAGTLIARVTAARGDARLDRIVQAVRAAQAERAPTERFIDRFAKIYTPAVVGLALLVAIVPPLLGHGTFLYWLERALVLLVIACPCALVLSTPITVVSALTAAAREGVLVKGGAYLEGVRHIKAIAFDKTGTLTEGAPKVTDVVPLNGQSPAELLHLAASLNAPSEHPIGAAIVTRCAGEHVCSPLPVQAFEALVGRGVAGTVNGARHFVGSHRLTHENHVCGPHVESVLARLESDGKTAVILTSADESLAVLGIADTPRSTALDALSQLKSLGIHCALLTGDNRAAAEAIGKTVGIDDIRAELLPDEKLAAIESLMERFGRDSVAMVGDGVNDAPALARASVGIAVNRDGAGAGSVALEVADIALLRDDLALLPGLIRLSRKMSTTLKQNIAFALGLKAIFFALALAGKATLWMAVFADVGASLLVVANGLRLLKARL